MNFVKHFHRNAAAAVCICLLAATALPLTVEKLSLERMTGESNTIVYASVMSAYAQWEGRNIYTYTTLRVRETLKGEPGQTIIVKQLGGSVGEIAQEISGSPKLRPGDDVVLFLVRWQNAFWIHSIVLGKFSVIREEGRLVAYNDLNNIGLIDPVTKEEITRPDVKANRIPLDNFLGEVRSFITKAR